MTQTYGFSFNNETCIQCYACEVACKSWRDVELGVKWRRVEKVWNGTYPEIHMSSVSISCMHCLAPACADACPEEAIYKRVEDGIVLVDREKCTGCQTCFDVCPFQIPQFGADEKMQKCDCCVHQLDIAAQLPPCVATCPTHSLQLELMTEDGKRLHEQSIFPA